MGSWKFIAGSSEKDLLITFVVLLRTQNSELRTWLLKGGVL